MLQVESPRSALRYHSERRLSPQVFSAATRAAVLVVGLVAFGSARAADPAGAPVPGTPDLSPARLQPTIDLPEWLAQATGLDNGRSEPQDSARLRWDVLPFVISNPLEGVGLGVATIGTFRIGSDPSTGYSTVAASGVTTTHAQRTLDIRSELRLPADRWILVGDYAANRLPSPAWGVGDHQPDSEETLVDERGLVLHETAYRRLLGPAYVGLGYFFDEDYDIVDIRAKAGEATAFNAYPLGTHGRSRSSGFTASFLLDGRDNPVDPWRGLYCLARFRLNPRWAGSDQAWQSLWVETRAYQPVVPRASLALWAYGWFTFGPTPYFMLPSNGGDPEMRSARGWIQGRHVGRALVGAEAELRVAIWQFVAGALGTSVHAVSAEDGGGHAPDFRRAWPAASAGVRLTLDRRSLSSLALDVGWRPGGHGEYIAFNQAF
jgi:hypothetical protein